MSRENKSDVRVFGLIVVVRVVLIIFKGEDQSEVTVKTRVKVRVGPRFDSRYVDGNKGRSAERRTWYRKTFCSCLDYSSSHIRQFSSDSSADITIASERYP